MNPRTPIQEELSRLSQKIMKLPAVHPFRVPDGYFETLPEKIMTSIRTENMTAREEIMQLSPVLAGLKEKDTYQVESDYFDQQNGTLAYMQHQHKKIISIRNWHRLAIAASFVGILGVGLFLFNQYRVNQDVITQGLAIKTDMQFNEKLNELDSKDILSYLNEYASVYDQREMEHMIDPNHLPDETDYLSDPSLNELMKEINEADINM